jgi:hypothetical protein
MDKWVKQWLADLLVRAPQTFLPKTKQHGVSQQFIVLQNRCASSFVVGLSQTNNWGGERVGLRTWARHQGRRVCCMPWCSTRWRRAMLAESEEEQASAKAGT